MELIWNEIKKIGDLNYSDDSVRGVYVWGFRIENKFIPYYVGVSVNVEKRILEHMDSLISGKYTIYHKDYLKDFSKYGNKNGGNEKQFEPKWPSNFLDFLKQRKTLNEHIDFMIDVSEYSYATVDENEIANNGLKEIEKYVISLFGVENLANSRGGESEIKTIKNTGCNELISLINHR